MSLFKLNRGNEVNLPNELNDGWAYFCTDTGLFLIDHYDSTNTLIRSKINAECADKLRYIQNEEPIDAPEGTLWIDLDAIQISSDSIVIFPEATASNNGKFLRVVNGAWDVSDIDLAGYATEEFVKNRIAAAELEGSEVDLSGYAQKSELPTKVSQLENDEGYLTTHQDISGKLDADKLPDAINTALTQAKASGEFDGKDGKAPIRGTDYWTASDIAEIKYYVDSAILGGAW